MKVALALFVKNEVNSIAHWVAWHLALGFDKLFIYDDESSDGTYEVLQSCAKMYDISLASTASVTKETNFFIVKETAFSMLPNKQMETFRGLLF